jgi:GT2 family glycosyltransferase
MKIGVVTVTYNSDSVLVDFIRCLSMQDYENFILYVVDNNSSDDSANLAQTLLSNTKLNYKIIKNEDNLGVACGNNIGIKLALIDSCDSIIIANNDIEFSSDAFSKLHSVALKNKRQLIAPKILFFDNQSLIWCAGGHFSKFRGVPRTRGFRSIDGAEFNNECFVTSVPTCFLFVPSEVFGVVGLMDEDYFVYLDDSDFICRTNSAGYKILYVPTPEILHKVSVSTGGENSPFTIYQITKNTVLFLRKNYSTISFLWYFTIFLFRCTLKVPSYDETQRRKLGSGLLDGVKKCIQMGVSKHNYPKI